VSPATARWRAGLLLYAAIQFVALTAIAMALYAEPYDLAGNFLSELGATRTWSGAPNHASAALFAIALGTLGLATIGFAGAWRAFAFGRGRARAVGWAAHGLGAASGAAFVAIAVAPVNLAVDLHNAFVIAAFGLLFGYVCAMTLLWWRNGASRVQLATSVAYVVLVGVYFAVVAVAVRTGVTTAHGKMLLVVSQKAVAAASMVYVGYLTVATRRQLATL
jgi:hypothetical protein